MAEPRGAAARARVFYALWPGPALARRIAAHGARLEAALGGRAARVETLHLTLAFIGDVDTACLTLLAAPPATVSASCFELQLDRCGVWPHNNIGWLAPATIPSALTLLQQRLALWLESVGFAPDPRPFQPHVSVVRRVRAPLSEAHIEPLTWPVADWRMVRSHLSAQGAGYEPLACFTLQGDDRRRH